jgi:hypothetical protein
LTALDIGEKYLTIKILSQIKLAAFKNKSKKQGDKLPDYSGDGVAVWISTKKAPVQKFNETGL